MKKGVIVLLFLFSILISPSVFAQVSCGDEITTDIIKDYGGVVSYVIDPSICQGIMLLEQEYSLELRLDYDYKESIIIESDSELSVASKSPLS